MAKYKKLKKEIKRQYKIAKELEVKAGNQEDGSYGYLYAVGQRTLCEMLLHRIEEIEMEEPMECEFDAIINHENSELMRTYYKYNITTLVTDLFSARELSKNEAHEINEKLERSNSHWRWILGSLLP